jgi:hypothetical protein
VIEMVKPDDLEKKLKKLVVNKSLKNLIIENWGDTLGKAMIKCLKKVLKEEDKPKEELEQEFIECVRTEGFDAVQITDEQLKKVFELIDDLDHYTKIG